MAEAGAEHPGGCTILKMRLESAIPHRARGDIPARQSELARGGDLRLVLDNRGHGAVHTAQPWMVVGGVDGRAATQHARATRRPPGLYVFVIQPLRAEMSMYSKSCTFK